MATVISKTNDKLNELFGDTIVDVELHSSGNLLVTNRNGFVTNVGYVGGSKTVMLGIQSRLAASRRGPIKIVTLGSSTTEGVGASTPDSRYVNQLAKAIQAAYPSGVEKWEPPVVSLTAAASNVPTLPGVHVINGGISGSTSASYLGATRLGHIDTVNPDIVIHMIGSNDYALSVDPVTYKANLKAAIESIDGAVSDVLHIVVDTFARPDKDPEVSGWVWQEYIYKMIEAVLELPNTHFIGVNNEFVDAGVDGYDPVDRLRLTDWRLGAGGGIHPSDSGHVLLASLITKEMSLPTPRVRTPAEVFDRFQRTALGNTETGQTWETQAGVFVPSGGALTVTTGGNVVVPTGFSDCEISALITASTGVVPGLITKSADSNTRLGVFLNGPSDRLEFYNGTTILSWTSALGLVTGREYFVKLTVSGDQMIAELDGVRKLQITLDPSVVSARATSVRHGIRCSLASAAAKWRNLAIRPV